MAMALVVRPGVKRCVQIETICPHMPTIALICQLGKHSWIFLILVTESPRKASMALPLQMSLREGCSLGCRNQCWWMLTVNLEKESIWTLETRGDIFFVAVQVSWSMWCVAGATFGGIFKPYPLTISQQRIMLEQTAKYILILEASWSHKPAINSRRSSRRTLPSLVWSKGRDGIGEVLISFWWSKI